MFILLTLFANLVHQIEGASGCRELKKEYPNYRIRLRPLRDSNGTCAIDKSCCNEEVERVVREESLMKMRRVVQREVDNARSSVQFIKSQAEGTTKRMMKELFPADMAAHINVDQVADIVWRYSVGEITAVDLLIEGAIAAMFTEQAEESVRATAECVMSELTKTAPDAFGQITGIVDEVLKAPRTFGRGLQVAESLLLAVENTELSSICHYDDLFGCQKCGIKLPGPCRASCVSSARSCLLEIYSVTPLWMVWVDSIASLTDALVLMKDIPIDPESIVDDETIATITRDIMGSMGNANYQKCLATKRLKRGAAQHIEESGYHIPGKRVRRDFSEGDMLKLSLEGNFVEYDMERSMCRDATSDSQCWLGDRVGDVDDEMLTRLQESERITKAYKPGTDMVSSVIHGYAASVNTVIAEIHQKVRAARHARYLEERGRRANN